MSGSLGDGSHLVVYDGSQILGNATISSSASGTTWSFDAGALANAGHTFSVAAVDAAGNIGTASSGYSVTVDADVPTVTATITNTAALTNQAEPVLQGTLSTSLPIGDSVLIYDGTTRMGTAIVDTAGTSWSFTPTQALLDGAHTLKAVVQNSFGNQSVLNPTYQVTIDTQTPAAPTITDTAIVGHYVNTLHDTATQALTGTADAGSTVQIYLNGSSTPSFKVVADANGHWSQTIGTLTDGTYTYAATVTNAAGTISAPSEPLSFTVDTVAPTVTINDEVSNSHTSLTEAKAGDTITATFTSP